MRTAGGIYAVYLPSLVMPAVLACVFGNSLRRGRQPLIEGVARASRGGVLPDELVVHTRNLTQLWTLRSEESSVGKEWCRTSNIRWLPYNLKKQERRSRTQMQLHYKHTNY